MHPDPLTTLSAFLARWAARQDDPDRAIPIPTTEVCAMRLTSAIMETRGAHASDTLAALWHHAGRPPMETVLSIDDRLRRVAIVTTGPIAAWTLYEDITLGGVALGGYRLIEIAAACGAASLTAEASREGARVTIATADSMLSGRTP